MLSEDQIGINDIKVPIPLNPEVLEKEYRELYIRHKILLGEKLTLIEKLEEDLNDLGEQTKDNYLREKANYTIRYLSEYRAILKGGKDE